MAEWLRQQIANLYYSGSNPDRVSILSARADKTSLRKGIHMAVTAAEMRAKIATGVNDLSQAEMTIRQAADQVQQTITLWMGVTDNLQMANAVAVLRSAVEELEKFYSQKAHAVAQAEAYAVRI